MVVMGTRPEALKLCPVVREMKRRRNLSAVVCSTGQHRVMLDSTMRVFSIRSDYRPYVMRAGQSAAAVTARNLSGMDAVLERERPDLVLVQGDAATAFGAALAAFHHGVPVGHVEAGLRTYQMRSPFPEEFHREAVSLLADFHFAPTLTAKANLIREGKPEKSIFLTGSTVVDALRCTLRQQPPSGGPGLPDGARVLLFTAHRRESFGEPLRGMLRALRRIVESHPDVAAVCPPHHNPAVRQTADEVLAGCGRVCAWEPEDIVAFHHLLAGCTLVLTDSGGLQEETTALGIPTLVMRYSTERSEGIRAGCLKLCGSGEHGIVRAAQRLLEPDSAEYAAMRRPSRVFGDGRASVRIVNLLERLLV